MYAWLRLGYHRRAQETCLEAGGREASLVFWKAVSLWTEGGAVSRERDAIQQMEICLEMGHRDYMFPACSALAWFHANVQRPDGDCVRKFNQQAQREAGSEEARVGGDRGRRGARRRG